jgi:two-component system response regulator AtoC
VLVVDDDAAVGTVLAALLAQAGMKAKHVVSGEAALRALEHEPADVVVTDLRMPGMDGMQLLSRIAAMSPGLPVIMLTAHGTVPLAVEAMRTGAADFVLKPFDREQIVFVVRKAMYAARHSEGREAAASTTQAPLVSSSPAMREVNELVARAARSTATVLIRGESGTGKELAARAIHDQSRRSKGPFVVIHCAALPDTLLESELFGHEKGAFTGAVCRKPGRIELADGGTLFLDEIGDVPLTMQVKLLRVLQERTFERLGGTESVKVDVRFVAATHQDLDAMVRAKAFREDLYYRLSVVPIVTPPLRARTGDIAPLVAQRQGRRRHRARRGRAPRARELAGQRPRAPELRREARGAGGREHHHPRGRRAGARSQPDPQLACAGSVPVARVVDAGVHARRSAARHRARRAGRGAGPRAGQPYARGAHPRREPTDALQQAGRARRRVGRAPVSAPASQRAYFAAVTCSGRASRCIAYTKLASCEPCATPGSLAERYTPSTQRVTSMSPKRVSPSATSATSPPGRTRNFSSIRPPTSGCFAASFA